MWQRAQVSSVYKVGGLSCDVSYGHPTVDRQTSLNTLPSRNLRMQAVIICSDTAYIEVIPSVFWGSKSKATCALIAAITSNTI